MIIPSAPAAIEASAIGVTYCQYPVPWLGSAIIGRWVLSLSTGMAFRSKVFLVAVSKVRIPLSHSITFSFPSARMYSEHIKNSLIVVDMPRFRSTGMPDLPTCFNSA